MKKTDTASLLGVAVVSLLGCAMLHFVWNFTVGANALVLGLCVMVAAWAKYQDGVA